MKIKTIITTLAIFITSFLPISELSAQQICLTCGDNEVTGNLSSAIGYQNIASAPYAFAAGFRCTASGYSAIGMGRYSEAGGPYSFALGINCYSSEKSIAMGFNAKSNALESVALGAFVETNAANSMVIGSSVEEYPLVNQIENSLMIGFNSSRPSLFIGPSETDGMFGRIGIGTIEPEAELHIEGSVVSMGNIGIGTTTPSAELHVEGSVVSIGNVGIGTTEPSHRLHITGGNIYLEDIDAGIIMRSPDGNCWKVTIDNSGGLISEEYDCQNNSGAGENFTAESPVKIYPNPANETLQIEVAGRISPVVEIYSSSGEMIFLKKYDSNSVLVDISFLTKGVYILRVKTGEGLLLDSKKLLKE